MIRRRNIFKLAMTAALFFSVSAFAEGKLSGLMFGDAYWFAKDHDTTTKLSSDAGYKDQSGFWMRRIYLTYDNPFEEGWTTRFRLEANSADFGTTTPTKTTPFVKDAYLQWTVGPQKYYIGLSSAPTFELIENHWGLRPVEKTPEDLWNFGPARDLGLAVKGNYADGLFAYHFMFGNGSSVFHEVNKGKKAYLSLSSAPLKNVLVELYGDYETNTHNITDHAFAGYKDGCFRVGALYTHTKQWSVAKKSYTKDSIGSLYGVLKATEKLDAFLRIDLVTAAVGTIGDSAYLHQSTAAKPTLYIAGVDYEIAKNIHIMPNFEMVTYDSGLDNDLIPRITFSWVF